MGSELNAAKSIISSLLVDLGEQKLLELFTNSFFNEVNRVFDEHDPLVKYSVEVVCPFCSKEFHADVDLEELAMKRLVELQKKFNIICSPSGILL